MFRKSLNFLAILVLSVCTTAEVVHAEPIPVDGNGNGHLTLFDTHDLVVLDTAGNQVAVTVLMFSGKEFDAIPGLGVLTFDELLALANRVLHYQCPQAALERLIIECRDGDDVVATAFNFPVPLELYGDEGDDYLQGGFAADILCGGPGNDWLDGVGDDQQDILKGGDDADVFVQYYRLVRGTRYGTVRIAEERIVDAREEDDIVSVYGD